MSDCRCRYCQQVFQPARSHPQQAVCSQSACQRQRRRDYQRQKIASDPETGKSRWTVPRSGAGRTPATGSNIASTILSRPNAIASGSNAVTKSAVW